MSDYDEFVELTEGEVTAGGSAGSEPAVAEGSTPSSPISPSVSSEDSGVASPPSAPEGDGGELEASLTEVPSVIKTPEEALVVLAKRVGHVGDLAVTGTGLAESDPVLPPARSANKKSFGRKKVPVPKGDGKCGAYAPFGTKCKLCGKVHPT